MADTQDSQMTRLLRRLMAHPAGQKIFGKPGLFTSKNPQAQKTIDALARQGLVAIDDETCRLTADGRRLLLDQSQTRVLLEDLLRATESGCENLVRMRQTLDDELVAARQFRHDLTATIRRLGYFPGNDALRTQLVETLALHREKAGACSVAELYEKLSEQFDHLTIGQFHDVLRDLRARGSIRLIPWTGPLYELPEPALALLVGHEVLYYVDIAGQ